MGPECPFSSYGAGGVAVDGSDNFYVLDHDRIRKFDSHGTPLAPWGTHGSEPGQFNYAA